MLICYIHADVLCAMWHVIRNLCLYIIVSAVYLRVPMCWCWGKTQSGTLIPRSLPPVMRFALGLIKHIWLFLSNNHQGRCYSSFVPQFVLPSPSSAPWDLDLILSPFLHFHCIMRGRWGKFFSRTASLSQLICLGRSCACPELPKVAHPQLLSPWTGKSCKKLTRRQSAAWNVNTPRLWLSKCPSGSTKGLLASTLATQLF